LWVVQNGTACSRADVPHCSTLFQTGPLIDSATVYTSYAPITIQPTNSKSALGPQSYSTHMERVEVYSTGSKRK
jgi:hypothetical protein